MGGVEKINENPFTKNPRRRQEYGCAFGVLGICCVEDLREKDPQELYDRDCMQHGYQDRCVLYVYRCAVYFAQTPEPDPEKCKWWNWKDGAVEKQS